MTDLAYVRQLSGSASMSATGNLLAVFMCDAPCLTSVTHARRLTAVEHTMTTTSNNVTLAATDIGCSCVKKGGNIKHA